MPFVISLFSVLIIVGFAVILFCLQQQLEKWGPTYELFDDDGESASLIADPYSPFNLRIKHDDQDGYEMLSVTVAEFNAAIEKARKQREETDRKLAEIHAELRSFYEFGGVWGE